MTQHIIRFSKMHALGNDFVVIDRLTQSFFLDMNVVRLLGHRRTGVGFDQLLVLEPPVETGHDFGYQSYNAQGMMTGHSLNALRVLAHYVQDHGFLHKRQLHFMHDHKVVVSEVVSHAVAKIVLKAQDACYVRTLTKDLPTSIDHMQILGEDHLVCWKTPRDERMPLIELLKKRGMGLDAYHISFALFDQDAIQLETYTKNIGRTLSCGSAAVASILAHAYHHELLRISLKVHTQMGYVTVSIQDSDIISLLGPVTRAFKGEFALRYQ